MAAMIVLILVFSLAGGVGGHMGSLGSYHSSDQASQPQERDAPKPTPEQAPHSH